MQQLAKRQATNKFVGPCFETLPINLLSDVIQFVNNLQIVYNKNTNKFCYLLPVLNHTVNKSFMRMKDPQCGAKWNVYITTVDLVMHKNYPHRTFIPNSRIKRFFIHSNNPFWPRLFSFPATERRVCEYDCPETLSRGGHNHTLYVLLSSKRWIRSTDFELCYREDWPMLHVTRMRIICCLSYIDGYVGPVGPTEFMKDVPSFPLNIHISSANGQKWINETLTRQRILTHNILSLTDLSLPASLSKPKIYNTLQCVACKKESYSFSCCADKRCKTNSPICILCQEARGYEFKTCMMCDLTFHYDPKTPELACGVPITIDDIKSSPPVSGCPHSLTGYWRCLECPRMCATPGCTFRVCYECNACDITEKRIHAGDGRQCRVCAPSSALFINSTPPI